MSDLPVNDLKPADKEDLSLALAHALRFAGKVRKHDAGALMASIVADRIVDHLDRCGFVVLKRAPILGSAPIARGAKEF